MKYIFQRVLVSAFLFITAYNTTAIAAPINITYTGTGSGFLDGVFFTDTHFTISAIGDTDNRGPLGTTPAGYDIEHDAVTIALEGLGDYEFLTQTRTFVNNARNAVGFSWGEPGYRRDLYNFFGNEVFSTWDMLSSVERFYGTGSLLQWIDRDVITTGGVLSFNTSSVNGSFQASVVPVPAAVWLFGSGLLALAGVLRRKLS